MTRLQLRSIGGHALTLAVCLVACSRPTAVTAVPMQIPNFAQSKAEIDARHLPTDLSTGLGYHIRPGQEPGSAQHFEIDTFIHTGARVPMAMNGIYSVLMEGGSYAAEARSMGFGADIRGAADTLRAGMCHVEVHDAGYVGDVKCFEASYAGDGTAFGQKESFIDHDHTSVHPLAGAITESDGIVFSNGWSLVPNGDSMELHDARGIVHIFR
jgi:hypothetical protein